MSNRNAIALGFVNRTLKSCGPPHLDDLLQNRPMHNLLKLIVMIWSACMDRNNFDKKNDPDGVILRETFFNCLSEIPKSDVTDIANPYQPIRSTVCPEHAILSLLHGMSIHLEHLCYISNVTPENIRWAYAPRVNEITAEILLNSFDKAPKKAPMLKIFDVRSVLAVDGGISKLPEKMQDQIKEAVRESFSAEYAGHIEKEGINNALDMCEEYITYITINHPNLIEWFERNEELFSSQQSSIRSSPTFSNSLDSSQHNDIDSPSELVRVV